MAVEYVDSDGMLPGSGEVWVDRRLLTSLNAAIGGEVEIGRKLFTITRIIHKEPDRSGGFMSLNPRSLINFSDVEETGVVQPGSRVRFRYMFAGDLAVIDQFKNWLEPQLKPSHRLLDIREDRPSVGSALDRAQRYLQLASIGAVILSGVAVAMAAGRFARRRQDTVAVMASFGFAAPVMGAIYLRLLLVLGVVAAVSGALLGYLLQLAGTSLVADLLPVYLPPAGWQPWGRLAPSGSALSCKRLPSDRRSPPSTWGTGSARGSMRPVGWRVHSQPWICCSPTTAPKRDDWPKISIPGIGRDRPRRGGLSRKWRSISRDSSHCR
ncbi:MAG: hypothetical protein R3311_21505, partial [Oceanisphaera sp.]|nr:hypothetical protein [Oceanisphaera sp.]